jgi:putative Holliday junction resolvase
MRILGIDYGKRKIGIALGDERLVEGLTVVRYEDEKKALEKIVKIIKKEKINEIVVGVSEGQIGEESRKFGEKLGKKVNLPVHFQDETLTTQDAQALAITAGIKRKKRRALEDAYSAALILQNYLDLR